MPFDVVHKPINVQFYFDDNGDYDDLIEWPRNMDLPDIGDEVTYCSKTMIVGRKVFNINTGNVELYEKEKING